MNPAALKVNLAELERGGIVVVNEDGFTDPNLRKANYESNPLDDGTLDDYQVFRVPMTSMTVRATEGIDGITSRDAARSKNLFALGLVSWMYSRPTDVTVKWLEEKFAAKPKVMEANLAAFKAGYNSVRRRSCSRSTTRSSPRPPIPAPTGASTGPPQRLSG